MNDMLQGKWTELRGDAKRRWGRLTNSDLDMVGGQMDRLVGLVQEKYGYSREKAQEQVNRFMETYGDNMQGFMGNARGWISRYPWSIAVVLLVIGLVAGVLVFKPGMAD